MSAVAARFVGRNLVRGSDAVERIVTFEVVDGHVVRVVRAKRVCRGLAGGDELLVELASGAVGHGVRAVVDDVVTVRTPEDLVDVAVIVPFGVEAAEQRRFVVDLMAVPVDLVEPVGAHHGQADQVQGDTGRSEAVTFRELGCCPGADGGCDADRDQPPVPVLPEHEEAQAEDQDGAEDARAEVVRNEGPGLLTLLLALLTLPVGHSRLLVAEVIGSRYSHNFPAFLRSAG